MSYRCGTVMFVTDRIEELTPEQEALMEVVAKEYIDCALRHGPVDEAELIAATKALYKFLGFEDPEVVIAESPLAAQMTYRLLSGGAGARVWARVEDRVWARVWDRVWDHQEYVATDWVGISNSGWVSFYDYWSRLGVEQPELGPLLRFIRAGGWDIVQGDGLAVVTLPPTEAHTDERGNLHNPRGPAISWKDGFELYFWHGTGVDDWVIRERENLTPERVLVIQNAEMRRAAIEAMGPHKLATDTSTIVLDTDIDGGGMPRKLYDVTVDSVRWRLVHVKCPSTGREYHLRVPPTVKTCREAVAWTFGMEDPTQYVTGIEA